MEAREAIAVAKNHVKELFSDEQVSNLGLEEIEFDGHTKSWNITLGFSRPWNSQRSLIEMVNGAEATRTYKIVVVQDDTRKAIKIKNRDGKAD